MKLHLLVWAQLVLLAALGAFGVMDWPWPTAGIVLFVLGCLVSGLAALHLGSSLTPSPEPNLRGLKTGGLYRWVRHPIYAGVLLCAAGVATTGVFAAAIFALLFIVLLRKIGIEEKHLARVYPAYPDYAKATKRFIPWIY